VSKFAVENSGGTMEMKDWMQAFIPSRMAAFEAMLDDPATGHFCHGDTPTMADICLVPQAFNAARWEIDLGPETSRILGALHELPAVQKAHPDHFKP
ncbi:MAG: glutathione S-transferase C-terminal domain-containing protein, partial [Pseudomonadota bacterium]